ncbi:hypothetical protein HDU96_007325 [Phlyctochytrium bullatum]|nr:hypothetical protein HDU96_007325 [Phlyctochytrium bullatum]
MSSTSEPMTVEVKASLAVPPGATSLLRKFSVPVTAEDALVLMTTTEGSSGEAFGYEAVVANVTRLFGLEDWTWTASYKDDEGDWIGLSSQEEFLEATRCKGAGALRLSITRKGRRTGNPVGIQPLIPAKPWHEAIPELPEESSIAPSERLSSAGGTASSTVSLMDDDSALFTTTAPLVPMTTPAIPSQTTSMASYSDLDQEPALQEPVLDEPIEQPFEHKNLPELLLPSFPEEPLAEEERPPQYDEETSVPTEDVKSPVTKTVNELQYYRLLLQTAITDGVRTIFESRDPSKPNNLDYAINEINYHRAILLSAVEDALSKRGNRAFSSTASSDAWPSDGSQGQRSDLYERHRAAFDNLLETIRQTAASAQQSATGLKDAVMSHRITQATTLLAEDIRDYCASALHSASTTFSKHSGVAAPAQESEVPAATTSSTSQPPQPSARSFSDHAPQDVTITMPPEHTLPPRVERDGFGSGRGTDARRSVSPARVVENGLRLVVTAFGNLMLGAGRVLVDVGTRIAREDPFLGADDLNPPFAESPSSQGVPGAFWTAPEAPTVAQEPEEVSLVRNRPSATETATSPEPPENPFESPEDPVEEPEGEDAAYAAALEAALRASLEETQPLLEDAPETPITPMVPSDPAAASSGPLLELLSNSDEASKGEKVDDGDDDDEDPPQSLYSSAADGVLQMCSVPGAAGSDLTSTPSVSPSDLETATTTSGPAVVAEAPISTYEQERSVMTATGYSLPDSITSAGRDGGFSFAPELMALLQADPAFNGEAAPQLEEAENEADAESEVPMVPVAVVTEDDSEEDMSAREAEAALAAAKRKAGAEEDEEGDFVFVDDSESVGSKGDLGKRSSTLIFPIMR